MNMTVARVQEASLFICVVNKVNGGEKKKPTWISAIITPTKKEGGIKNRNDDWCFC